MRHANTLKADTLPTASDKARVVDEWVETAVAAGFADRAALRQALHGVFGLGSVGAPLAPTQLDSILNSINDGIVLADASGEVVKLNPAALRIYDFPSPEVALQSIEAHAERFQVCDLTGKAVPKTEWPLKRALRGECVHAVELRVTDRSTGRSWVASYSAAPVYDVEGRITHAIVTVRDVTRRQRIEAALRDSERRFRSTFDNAVVGIAHLDRAGHWTRSNRRLREILGYDIDELRGRTLAELTHPEDSPADLVNFGPLMRGEISNYSLEKRMVHRKGDYVWVRQTMTTHQESQGAALYCIMTLEDITAQKELEQHLADRVRQQSAIAAISRYALDEPELGKLLHRAAASIAATLSVDSCVIKEFLSDRDGFLVRAGVGLRADVVGTTIEPNDDETQAGLALRSAQLVLVEDFQTEPRFRPTSLHRDHDLRSGVCCPIAADQPRPFGVVCVYSRVSRTFGSDEMTFLETMATVLSSAVTHHRHEERRRLLVSELNHRVKNTLAMVQSIASQTREYSPDPPTFHKSFTGRLRALAKTHGLLTRRDWEGALLTDLVTAELEPFRGESARLETKGPLVVIRPRATLPLHLILHELVTNACKYGALSTDHGQVRITWDIVRGAQRAELLVRWTEHGGPPVEPPTHRGFGSEVIDNIIQYELEGTTTLDFAPGGVRCEIRLPWTGEIGFLVQPSAPSATAP